MNIYIYIYMYMCVYIYPTGNLKKKERKCLLKHLGHKKEDGFTD